MFCNRYKEKKVAAPHAYGLKRKINSMVTVPTSHNPEMQLFNARFENYFYICGPELDM